VRVFNGWWSISATNRFAKRKREPHGFIFAVEACGRWSFWTFFWVAGFPDGARPLTAFQSASDSKPFDPRNLRTVRLKFDRTAMSVICVSSVSRQNENGPWRYSVRVSGW
jgi:hypothetical protein